MRNSQWNVCLRTAGLGHFTEIALFQTARKELLLPACAALSATTVVPEKYLNIFLVCMYIYTALESRINKTGACLRSSAGPVSGYLTECEVCGLAVLANI